MNYLLDTHILLWALNQPEKLPRAMRDILENPGQQIWFSVASLWEIEIKSARGHLDFTYDARSVWRFARDTLFLELQVEAIHVFQLKELPRWHGDPFDRILLAQAKASGMNLLTVDSKLLEYLEAGPIQSG